VAGPTLTSNRDFSKDLLKDAKAVRDHNEKYAQLAKWIGTGLYTLGWSLTLFSRMFGLGDIPEGE
jgi:hypothetical protein